MTITNGCQMRNNLLKRELAAQMCGTKAFKLVHLSTYELQALEGATSLCLPT